MICFSSTRLSLLNSWDLSEAVGEGATNGAGSAGGDRVREAIGVYRVPSLLSEEDPQAGQRTMLHPH